MCPDMGDKADSGTKGSVAVRTWKRSKNQKKNLDGRQLDNFDYRKLVIIS